MERKQFEAKARTSYALTLREARAYARARGDSSLEIWSAEVAEYAPARAVFVDVPAGIETTKATRQDVRDWRKESLDE